MKKIFIIIAIFAFATGTNAQNHLKNLRNKTTGQIANAANGTFMDSTFFKNRIGVLGQDLAAAMEVRALTPYDFSTLAIAKDTAVSRQRPLMVPRNYTASTLTFKAADSALCMFVYGTINITESDTIPAGAYIEMKQAGRFNISSGKTLRINGYFLGGRKQRFIGAGTVIFGDGATEELAPEVFGAKIDSTFDSGPAFKKAIDALPNGGTLRLSVAGRTLLAPNGYLINTTVRMPSDRNITVRGNGAVIYSSAADTVFLFQNGSQDTIPSYALSPTTLQPRHVMDHIRFRRIAGSTGTGVAIALVNTTGQVFERIEVGDFNNAFSFHNKNKGWCEDNSIWKSRIAGCDTAILYMKSGTGNNSMATNSLHDVTITRFTDSDVINQEAGRAVGIFVDTGINVYRNVWDGVVIFPKDSVTAVYIDGKAEELTGTLNIEYIGDTERPAMRGIHFGANSSELKFGLRMNITGRPYFKKANVIYNESGSSFGYNGLTMTMDGSQNHGIEIIADSSTFTPLVSIVRANTLGMTTPGDSARIFYAQVNNTEDGRLDLRARRNQPIEIRSITDNLYSSATSNNVGGSALPFQPVRALIVGSNRTMSNAGAISDSTTIDVRNSTFILFGSGTSTVDELTAFTGGVLTQEVSLQFTDDSTTIVNLSGASGSGRLFLKENKNLRSVTGLRMRFRAEAESGGIFWREVWRQFPEQVRTATNNDPTPAVSTLKMLRVNNGSPTSISNFLEDGGSISGRSERILTVVFLNGNTTIQHNANIILAGGVSYTGSSGDVMQLQYDETAAVWREIGRTGSASAPVVGVVDSSNISNPGVSPGDIVDGAILNAKYANGSLTVNKFATSVYPAIRGRVGFTSNGTITSDTLVTRLEYGGRANTTAKFFDADGDTVSIAPQSDSMFELKDGGTTLFRFDSTGAAYGGTYSTLGAGNMVLGGALTTTINVTTDGTGDAELVVPNNSISTTEMTTTGVVAASYTNANITVDAAGRITAAASGSSSMSVAQARKNTGWTTQGGLIAQDTTVQRIEWGGTANASAKFFDNDGDTVIVKPQTLYPLEMKEGSTQFWAVDSAGWETKPDMIEFLGGALKETSAAGADDSTQYYLPAKAFAVNDTATFDFSTSKRFVSLDSIVVIAWSNQASSSVVFNVAIKQVQISGALSGAFNAASSKTISTGTAGTLKQWSFTSFGSVTASVWSHIVGKLYRTSGGTGGTILVAKVLIYGVGLR